MPYFFLSYANADGNGYLETFYRDLAEAVRGQTGLRSDQIGFWDRSNLELGESWPPALVDAVATARVFVALCSPSYFASTYCGKEWQLFTDLAQRRRPAVSATGGCLVPVTWIPTKRGLPETARHLQHSHGDLGEIYRREGLQYLAKLRRFRDEYQNFITRLAERIVTVGGVDAPPLPGSYLPSLNDTPNAFRSESANHVEHQQGRTRRLVPEGDDTSGPRPPGGPKHVNFVLLASSEHTIAQVRRETQFYGPTPQDWAPYKPDSPQRICVVAQSIAVAKDLTSTLEVAESSILGLLARARMRNEVVVLLIDAWATKLDHYHQILVEYDEVNAPASAVIVPWSSSDVETVERSEELHDDLCRALPNNSARGDTVYRTAIPTHERFTAALEAVLAELQSRIFHYGKVNRRAGGARIVDRPVLSTPPLRAFR